MTLKQRLSLWLAAALFLLLALGTLEASSFGSLAAYFPIAVAGVSALLAGVEIVLMQVDRKRAAAAAEPPDTAAEDATLRRDMTGGALNLLWLGIYVAGMLTIGFFSATVAFLFLMLWKGAKYSPIKAALLSVGFCVLLDVFGGYIGLVFPSGFIDGPILDLIYR